MNHSTGTAYVVDNRDGSIERVTRYGRSVGAARAEAFRSAREACDDRNRREGFARFVALSFRGLHGVKSTRAT